MRGPRASGGGGHRRVGAVDRPGARAGARRVVRRRGGWWRPTTRAGLLVVRPTADAPGAAAAVVMAAAAMVMVGPGVGGRRARRPRTGCGSSFSTSARAMRRDRPPRRPGDAGRCRRRRGDRAGRPGAGRGRRSSTSASGSSRPRSARSASAGSTPARSPMAIPITSAARRPSCGRSARLPSGTACRCRRHPWLRAIGALADTLGLAVAHRAGWRRRRGSARSASGCCTRRCRSGSASGCATRTPSCSTSASATCRSCCRATSAPKGSGRSCRSLQPARTVVLKAPHHGSATSSTPALLDALAAGGRDLQRRSEQSVRSSRSGGRGALSRARRRDVLDRGGWRDRHRDRRPDDVIRGWAGDRSLTIPTGHR